MGVLRYFHQPFTRIAILFGSTITNHNNLGFTWGAP